MAKSLRRGEIWMTDLLNEDRENISIMKGFRPTVMVSNEIANTNPGSTIVMIVTITSNPSIGLLPTHILLDHLVDTNRLKTTSTALCQQIITVEKNQVRHCLGKVTKEELEQINNALNLSLGISVSEVASSK